MSYRLAPKVDLVERDGEWLLISPAPLRILKVNRSLAALLDGGRSGSIVPDSPGIDKLLAQLCGKGFLERLRSDVDVEMRLPTVSVVIPVKDRAAELRRCLESIRATEYPGELLQVIVVDDGSSDSSASVAASLGALVIPSGGTGRGPAAARNAGASIARGEILAFIDSDCTASAKWLADLIPAFSDGNVVAVGGFVDGMCRDSAVDRYEAVMSSLSLGGREQIGSSGDDTFYLPSCNLLVRRAPFNRAGGFNEAMHVGEDVDLTWRLRDLGWTIAYLPVGRVFHEHRSTLRSFMSRRFDYGTSEGTLQRLHPSRHKKMVVPPLLALVLSLCIAAPLVGWWLLAAAAAILTFDSLTVRRRLRRGGVPFGFASVALGRIRSMGSLAYYLSYHLIRYYSVPLMLISLVDSRLLPVFPLVALCASAVDYAVRKPETGYPAFVAIYLLEQLSYGSGVFMGCVRGGTFASYRVEMLRHMESAA